MTALVQPICAPKVEAIRQHVEHLFGGYLDGHHDGLMELAWTETKADRNGKYPLANGRLFPTDQIDQLIDEAVRLNSQPMCNVYIGAALRKPGTAPFARAKDSDALALTAVYVDLDDAGAALAAKDIYGKAKPTLIVVTGRAPHLRAQMWWKLDEPVIDPDLWSPLLRGMAAALRGDSTVYNASRVMRLAGTVAWPIKDGRTREMTDIGPIREPGQAVYAFSHLASLFPPIQGSSQAGAPTGVTHTTNTLGLADKINDGRERYMRDTVAAAMIEFIGENGATPTAQDLFDAAWPQYERKVDLTRSGRGADEFMTKCAYTIQRFERGDIRGIETLDKAVEIYRAKSQARLNAPAPVAEIGTAPPADESIPILVGDLSGQPPEREWIIPDWMPKGTVSSLSGDGGMGKTLIAQQLLYAVGVGGKWLGLPVPKLRGLGVFCEDDKDELHRRHDDIKADLGYAIGNPFEETWIWPRVGSDNLLVTFDKENRPLMSPFFADIMRHVMAKRIELLVLDTIADLFGGNEIIRAQVNYFIKAACGSFITKAKEAGFTLSVLLLSHPSQAGRNSGTGESGSTAWNNAVRARMYLTRPEDGLPEQRILTRKKSNYSASGDDVKIDLLWSKGVLKAVNPDEVPQVALASLESQILQSVNSAEEAGRPFKARKGSMFLDAEMVAIFQSRFAVPVILTALNNLKSSGRIETFKTKDQRGWRVAKTIKRGGGDAR